MTVSIENCDHLVSCALWKNNSCTLTRFIIFNMRIYNSYMLLLSKEPARKLTDVREELRQLNLDSYIIYSLLENHPYNNIDIRGLSDLLKDNFVDHFSEKKGRKRYQ